MELVAKVKLDDFEKVALTEGLNVLAQYCGLVSCRNCLLKELCKFSPEGSEHTFPDELKVILKSLLE